MKMKRVTLTYEKTFEFDAYFPEDTSDDKIREVADATADELERSWMLSLDWETSVGRIRLIDVPTEELVRAEKNKLAPYWEKQGDDALVYAPNEDEIVNPRDAVPACWWQFADPPFDVVKVIVSPNQLVLGDEG